MRSFEVLGFRSVAAEVSIAQIVRHDHDDVGFLG